MDLTQADKDAVSARHKDAAARMDQLRGRNLSLDMTRGKPSPEQLDLADDLLTCVTHGETKSEDGTDLRNYGGLAGIPEARRLFAAFLGTEPDRVIVGGNSSLTMMWDVLANAMSFGMPDGDGPWRDQAPKFICPVPGYDRHFAICERLGIEMGLYDTPAKQMGRLSYEMWRATRLVVDTGIHAKGWTKQQAVDFMTDNTALSAANIDAEVNRYITWPGQALAYKLGELKIRELRTRAEAALGERFDLRAFHDTVLENGSVPLDVLEAHVDAWIAAELAE